MLLNFFPIINNTWLKRMTTKVNYRASNKGESLIQSYKYLDWLKKDNNVRR